VTGHDWPLVGACVVVLFVVIVWYGIDPWPDESTPKGGQQPQKDADDGQ